MEQINQVNYELVANLGHQKHSISLVPPKIKAWYKKSYKTKFSNYRKLKHIVIREILGARLTAVQCL